MSKNGNRPKKEKKKPKMPTNKVIATRDFQNATHVEVSVKKGKFKIHAH